MSKAFVDTTVLVDALLKEGPRKEQARGALAAFKETLLPVYAIKEFKAGALKNFIWVHNKLVDTKSYDATLAAVQRMAMSPRRYLPATALEALAAIGEQYKRIPLGQLVEKYGESAKLDACLYDHARLSLKRRIAKAWRGRRELTTSVVCELSCYVEGELQFEESGQLNPDPIGCDKGSGCCIANELGASANVKKVEQSISSESPRAEDKRRRAALRLIRLGRSVDDGECRNLGDAVFALQCPFDAAILTTNERDHRPLAAAVGRQVLTPAEVLGGK